MLGGFEWLRADLVCTKLENRSVVGGIRLPMQVTHACGCAGHSSCPVACGTDMACIKNSSLCHWWDADRCIMDENVCEDGRRGSPYSVQAGSMT